MVGAVAGGPAVDVADARTVAAEVLKDFRRMTALARVGWTFRERAEYAGLIERIQARLESLADVAPDVAPEAVSIAAEDRADTAVAPV